MITMQEVYENCNKWVVQQYDINNQYREQYEVKIKSWWQKIAEYLKEII